MMQLPLRGISSQRYSPAEDYTYDHQHEVIQNTTRRPLGESTGNAQPQSLAALALCHQSQLSLSPPALHSIPTPPILPTQAITSTYATSFRNQRSFHRNVSLQDTPMAHSRGGRNPIYSWKHFADYRAKVKQKESENGDATWPLYLEDAFLDALLLVPMMGRKKFSSKGVLYGRNMLISEYLWICHLILFPPAQGEVLPVGKAREKNKKWPVFRDRKQVSSHIQVLKGFFLSHPLLHFFIPRKNDEKGESRRNLKEEDGEIQSFKDNRVLIALAEGRLPDERPNYDYFAKLLGGDSETFVKPKTCWIYVSSSDVTMSDDCRKAFASDGACLEADGYSSDGGRLDGKGDYPHLVMNGSKDRLRDLGHDKDGCPNYLLHEYTQGLHQTESSSIREISSSWNQRFPELREKLVAALDETHPSHERTARSVIGPCDTIHFDVVLGLHATSQFPAGTHLDGVVQLSICRPELMNHTWRSVTSVVKPRELDFSDDEKAFWNFPKECELSGPGNTKDTIEVPFPAKSWANTFIRLAKYVTAERERKERERLAKGENGSRLGSRTRKDSDGDDEKPKSSGKVTTPMDLLKQVAMYQEIWSAPNDGSSDKQRWTRRAVILWTFSNVYTKKNSKGELVTVPPGTNWRFLSKVDPTSKYHQQRAYVSGSPHVSRDSIMSPNPGYAHHLSAGMHEHFSSGYDAPTHITLPGHHYHQQQQQQQHISHLTNINLLDDFSNGLATPPSTASLPSSYAHSFDTQTIASTDSLHHNISFLSDGSTDSQGTMVGGDHDHSVDPFLAGLGVPITGGGAYDEQDPCDPNLQAWATAAGGLHGLDPVAVQWGATTYADGQQSLAWADQGIPTTSAGGDLADAQWARDDTTTPWHDGSDSLWATTTTSSGNDGNITTTANAHDGWATATSDAWLQSIGAVAEASNNSGSGGWDDHGLHQLGPSLATTSSALQQQHAQVHDPDHKHHNVSGVAIKEDDVHSVYSSTPPSTASSMFLTGRKRSRAEGDDEDDGDHKGYPVHSIRKLTHNAPLAVMKEEGQGTPFL